MTQAEAVALLHAAGVDGAARDVQKLWAEAAGDAARFAAMIERRAALEPVAKIIGRRAFWKHEFCVTPDVLDPRPDSETLVDCALQVPFETVLDLGTGSGCLVVSLLAERSEARGLGIDISPAALDVAKGNGTRIGVGTRLDLAVSDWFSQVEGRFDLIVSNPPYIDAESFEGLSAEVRIYDPKLALCPGGDGLDAYRVITAHARDYLAKGGWLMVEIGFDQAVAVQGLFERGGLEQIRCVQDLNGKDRVVLGRIMQ